MRIDLPLGLGDFYSTESLQKQLSDRHGRLAVYRTWCTAFHRALGDGNWEGASRLLRWLWKVHGTYPPLGVSAAVEGVRVFFALRAAFECPSLGGDLRDLCVRIAARHSLLDLLPFMQTDMGWDDFEDIVAAVCDVDADNSDSDSESPTNRQRDEQRLVGTATHALQLFMHAHDDSSWVSLGEFDRLVLEYHFDLRPTRSAAYAAVLSYMQCLERYSDCVHKFADKYIEVLEVLAAQLQRVPPCPGVLRLARSRIAEQRELADEVDYGRAVGSVITSTLSQINAVTQHLKCHLGAKRRVSEDGFIPPLSSTLHCGGVPAAAWARAAPSGAGKESTKGVQSGIPKLGRRSSRLLIGVESFQDARYASTAETLHTAAATANRDAEEVSGDSGAYGRREAKRQTRYFREYFTDAPPDALVAEVDDVWVQMDPVTARLVSGLAGGGGSEPGDAPVSETELTSVSAGRFTLRKSDLSWVILEPAESMEETKSPGVARHAAEGEQGGGLNAAYNRTVAAASAGLANAEAAAASGGGGDSRGEDDEAKTRQEESWTPQSRVAVGTEPKKWSRRQSMELISSLNSLSESLSSQLPPPTGGSKGPRPREESRVRIHLDEIQRFTWGVVGEGNDDAFYLSIYMKHLFKFFPFKQHEVIGLVEAITDLTGLEPFSEEEYIESVLKHELEVTRAKILQDFLLTRDNAWISHTEDLQQVMQHLTSENNPVKIIHLERLYHSCRLNEEVTRETITIAKRFWADTKSEIGRLKILAVLERVMDGNILHGGDPKLADVIHWLHSIESQLDPFKSAASLKMLLSLCARADKLFHQKLTPMSNEQLADSFQHLREFQEYQSNNTTS